MIERLGFQRSILFHRNAGGCRILELVKFVHGKADIVEKLVGHVAAETLLAERTQHSTE